MDAASRSMHFFALGSLLLGMNVHSIRFTAITDIDQRYLTKLYVEEWNKDPPSELDPATTDPSARQKICDEISNSGFLTLFGRRSVGIKEIYPQLNEARYNDDLFPRIYRPTDTTPTRPDWPSSGYINAYMLKTFKIRTRVPVDKTEYTFVCLIMKKDCDEISTSDSEKTKSVTFEENERGTTTSGNEGLNSMLSDDEVHINPDVMENIEMDEQTEMPDVDDWVNVHVTDPASGNEPASDLEYNSMNVRVTENTEVNEANLDSVYDEHDRDSLVTNDSTSEDGRKCTTGISQRKVLETEQSDGSIRIVVPFYVSKAYYLSNGPHVHRFVFWKEDQFHRVMLAEGSGHVYTRPDFNVELHYLELRKHRQPVAPSSPELDPVCKLNSGGLENSQLFRLCAIVLTASGFKDTIEYVAELYFGHWWYSDIMFRTPEAREYAAGNTYRELTLECHAHMIGGGTKIFHVSRAYNPNEVFVYTEYPLLYRLGIRLESLVKNVPIVNEPYFFGTVEI